jgi:hypothetical protein
MGQYLLPLHDAGCPAGSTTPLSTRRHPLIQCWSGRHSDERRDRDHEIMKRTDRDAASAALACDGCGQLPHPHKARLTLANVAVMLPVELLVHAAVVNTEMPYLQKVLVLTLTATVLVIWVAEPSVRRALRDWLHAPTLRHQRRLHASPTLWRVRTLVDDDPSAQGKLARSLAGSKTDILGLQLHPVAGGVLTELLISAPEYITQSDLLASAEAGGGRSATAWPTTALALADGQTKALSLALRVAGNPDELQLAVADLLGAELVPDPPSAGMRPRQGPLLKIPSPRLGPLFFARPQALSPRLSPPEPTVWPNWRS